ncbi:tripartite tricarboxylate transporter TctB family protein [Pseudahrensia aquimaris]|uniref:Tripartite tricarboxylate transporter TctB family protein n=1 Tax=Pseudahrensia aquimaris TaxID=744461 RepID=A0ABW3FEA7_9HYPH
MQEENFLLSKTRTAGQFLFFAAFLALSLFLLSLAGWQTRWIEDSKLFAQPRFWPVVALVIMAAFSALHLWRLKRRRLISLDWQEAKIWAQPLEYVAWFMAYVWTVPVIGYLLASLIFPPLLCYRIGYRDRKLLAASVLFGLATVIVFKSLLSVRIPGGMIYEALPDTLRSFFILYL